MLAGHILTYDILEVTISFQNQNIVYMSRKDADLTHSSCKTYILYHYIYHK